MAARGNGEQYAKWNCYPTEMKRILIGFVVLGCVTPLVLLLIQQVLLSTDPGRVSHFRAVWYYVWPAAVFLVAAAGASLPVMLLIVGMALIANVLLYGLLGLVVGLCWMLMSRPSLSGARTRSNH